MAATCEATAKLLHQRKRSSTCGKQPSSQEPTRLSHKLRALLELRDGASGTRRAMEGGEGREGEEDQAKPGRSAGGVGKPILDVRDRDGWVVFVLILLNFFACQFGHGLQHRGSCFASRVLLSACVQKSV